MIQKIGKTMPTRNITQWPWRSVRSPRKTRRASQRRKPSTPVVIQVVENPAEVRACDPFEATKHRLSRHARPFIIQSGWQLRRSARLERVRPRVGVNCSRRPPRPSRQPAATRTDSWPPPRSLPASRPGDRDGLLHSLRRKVAGCDRIGFPHSERADSAQLACASVSSLEQV